LPADFAGEISPSLGGLNAYLCDDLPRCLAEMMLRRLIPILLIALAVGTSAHAQFGGPGGGGRGGGHGGQGQPPSDGNSPAPAPKAAPPPKPPKPMNRIQIVGVVQAIDPDSKRVTITYDANDELNWPRGTTQFGVYTADLLKGVSVGEKVRFTLDSDQISEIGAY
jgi:hypothetical protein